MATYAIGDVQGCFLSLQRLLHRIDYRPARDRLILLGDMVGRGPDALGVLRFASRQPGVDVVLGNHDLFLIACAHGVLQPSPADKLDGVLAAADKRKLIEWLTQQPFARVAQEFLCVHAGVLPAWSVDDILRMSTELSATLASPMGTALLRRLFNAPRDSVRTAAPLATLAADASAAARTSDRAASFATESGVAPTGTREQRSTALPYPTWQDEALEVLTCVRALDGNGAMLREAKGGLAQLPPGAAPWFRAAGRRTAHVLMATGHWSALGCYHEGNVYALDGGCVWGQQLCALRLEDRATFAAANAEHEAGPRGGG